MHSRVSGVEGSVTHCVAVPTVLFTGISKLPNDLVYLIQNIICRHSRMLLSSLLNHKKDSAFHLLLSETSLFGTKWVNPATLCFAFCMVYT